MMTTRKKNKSLNLSKLNFSDTANQLADYLHEYHHDSQTSALKEMWKMIGLASKIVSTLLLLNFSALQQGKSKTCLTRMIRK